MAWAEEMWASRRWPMRLRLGGLRRSRARTNHPELAGSYAVRALPRMSDATHAAALGLVDELIGMGSAETRQPERRRATVIDRPAVHA